MTNDLKFSFKDPIILKGNEIEIDVSGNVKN
jgi:hypothetical protein